MGPLDNGQRLIFKSKKKNIYKNVIDKRVNRVKYCRKFGSFKNLISMKISKEKDTLESEIIAIFIIQCPIFSFKANINRLMKY